MVSNSQPDHSYPLPQGSGNIQPQGAPEQPPPRVFSNTPLDSGQLSTFTPMLSSGIPASSVPKEKRQPDLQRFARKELGNLTSRLEALRKQVDPQSLQSHSVKPALRMRKSGRTLTGASSIVNWYRSLNSDTKIGLACICLLVVLILVVSILAFAGVLH
jgi:hypothetical protein